MAASSRLPPPRRRRLPRPGQHQPARPRPRHHLPAAHHRGLLRRPLHRRHRARPHLPGSGLKLAYSGDCRPSGAFAALGRGAHLLVHECTFDDELAGDARAKKHSTLSEALGVGRKMEARRILLTHFSQRYPKLPVVSEETLRRGREGGREKDVEVLFAFDLMRVRLGEFKQASCFCRRSGVCWSRGRRRRGRRCRGE